jgi:tetratricopeptide (TPR) repeat protein
MVGFFEITCWRVNNMKFAKSTFLISMLLSGALFSATAIASGGGGGGGGGGGFSSPSQSAPSFNPTQTYRESVAYLQNGEDKKAARGFRKLAASFKKNANFHYLYGITQYNLGKYKRAVKPFKNAIKYKDDHVMAQGYLSAAYQQLGKTEEASTLRDALVDQMNRCSGCDNKESLSLALQLANGDKIQKSAFLQLNQNLGNTEHGDQSYLAAVAYINRGEYQQALTSLYDSSESFGIHPDVLTYLGFVNRKLGNMDIALEYYQTALSIDDDHRGANEYLGELYVETDQMPLAQSQLAKLEQICDFGCEEAEELKRWITDATS